MVGEPYAVFRRVLLHRRVSLAGGPARASHERARTGRDCLCGESSAFPSPAEQERALDRAAGALRRGTPAVGRVLCRDTAPVRSATRSARSGVLSALLAGSVAHSLR